MRGHLTSACGPRQYGFARNGGAPLEAADIEAAMNANTTWPVATLDIKNAFGAVRWTDALDVAGRTCPPLSPVIVGAVAERPHNAPDGAAPRGMGRAERGRQSSPRRARRAPHVFIILLDRIRKRLDHLKDDPRLRLWLYADYIVVQALLASGLTSGNP